jgi:hypothetical protein
MYFPRNWEFGSALSKLRNNFGGVWTPKPPPPRVRQCSVVCKHVNMYSWQRRWRTTMCRRALSPGRTPQAWQEGPKDWASDWPSTMCDLDFAFVGNQFSLKFAVKLSVQLSKLLYCLFRTLKCIKTLVTQTDAQFYNLFILYITHLLRVSALSPSPNNILYFYTFYPSKQMLVYSKLWITVYFN